MTRSMSLRAGKAKSDTGRGQRTQVVLWLIFSEDYLRPIIGAVTQKGERAGSGLYHRTRQITQIRTQIIFFKKKQ